VKWGSFIPFAAVAMLPFVSGGEKKPPTPMPESLVLGRHTFIDIGPPFDFYEILSVHRKGTATAVERIIVSPPGDPCTQPASVESGHGVLTASIPELLGSNPCSIPEKALRKELKRCKKCLVFSGAQITMSVQCGTESRLIRMDVLDRDMFDPAPKTPEHTSWTMALFARLDQALGPGVLERPVFALDELQRDQGLMTTQSIEDLRYGAFDPLFKQAPHKPSELYLKAQSRPRLPTVVLAQVSPVHPISEFLPPYPPLARAARISGTVSFTLLVTADGHISNFRVTSGHPLLRKAVEDEVTKWRFSMEAAGQSIEGSMQFSINCSQ
jgi:TonB family protein